MDPKDSTTYIGYTGTAATALETASPVSEALFTIAKDTDSLNEHFEALATRLGFVCRPGNPRAIIESPASAAEQSGLVASLGMTHERLLSLLNRIDDVASRLEL